MIFNSIEFAVFFLILLCLYYNLDQKNQNWTLLLAGFIFYGAWDVRFLYLVALSTVIDYCNGLMIGIGQLSLRQRLSSSAYLLGFAILFLVPDWHAFTQDYEAGAIDWTKLFNPTIFGIKVLLISSVAVITAHILYPIVIEKLPLEKRRLIFLRCSLFGQLGMLAVFKYYNFFIGEADQLLTHFGLNPLSFHLDIILPIGISFYTFQTLSYVLDVYWNRLQAVQRLRDFALFVCYFPPLVAGPIERAAHLIPKILGKREINFEMITQGGYLIMLGLVKKMTIADGLASSVASIYNSTGDIGWLDIVASTLAFAMQIYCDFSGYSDIACGVSLWLGIELIRNFDQPYFSVNPAEFWRRWHISLSSWLRDYLYIPLGGNRGGESKTRRNLLITMILGGLWHGAAWNFVLWGTYQGLLLVIHRMFSKANKFQSFNGGLMARLPRMLMFFVLVCYGWLLFRANSLSQIIDFTETLLTNFSDLTLHMKIPPFGALIGVLFLLTTEVIQFKTQNIHFYTKWHPIAHGAFYSMLIVLLIFGGVTNGAQQFIYFQF